jgi:fructan beta-fructosidase
MPRPTARLALVFALLLLTAPAAFSQTRPDILREEIVIADFEAESYGEWKTTGAAFGKAPARGTLPGQMHVEGHQGKGLVNSFLGGDDAIGTLTSPAFTLDRKFINFLIGGGGWKDETCLQLKVAGKIVRTKAGPNTAGGGSERLDWASWDVTEFAGKEAVIEIIDSRKGGWGHINVDQITQSDTKKEVGPAKLKLEVAARYLRLPSKRGATNNRLKVTAQGKLLVDCDIQLSDQPQAQPFLFDLGADKKAPATVEVEIARLANDSPLLSTWKWFTDDAEEGLKDVVRPRFHFTAKRGWLNDPNGLVYHDGKYHLYFQHNPFGSEWGNMHWGHAVSTDLLNWTELPIAIAPPKHGDWAFSGSAMIDTENRSGWGTKENPPIVAAWTSTGRGECISYSTDGGLTFKEYEGNPVVKHQGRDPRILWHEESKHFVMAVYNESEGKQWIAFHNSPDLKKWTFTSKIEGYFECPELFPMIWPASGKTKWILYAADGQYVVGDFDGKTFTPEGKKHQLWYGNFYASQTFSNAPDSRRIQIGWARGIDSHNEAYNQQMNAPCELTLGREAGEFRLRANPVVEFEKQRQRSVPLAKVQLSDGEKTIASTRSRALDLECELMYRDGIVELDVLGNKIRFAPEEKIVECGGVKAPYEPGGIPQRLRVLLDSHSIEIFVNGGGPVLAAPALTQQTSSEIRLRSTKDCELVAGALHELLASPAQK